MIVHRHESVRRLLADGTFTDGARFRVEHLVDLLQRELGESGGYLQVAFEDFPEILGGKAGPGKTADFDFIFRGAGRD